MKRRLQYYFILGLSALLAALWLSPEPVLSKDKKKRERAFLGVSVQEVSKKYRKKYDLKRGEGVLVTYVTEDSPADFADLERHDIILEFDGARLKSPRHLNRLVRKHKPGDKVTLFIIHDGKKKKVRVELTEPPEDETENLRFFGGANVFSIHPGNRPYLGVYLQQLNRDLARYFKVDEEAGVLITEVEEDSPAADAGIKPGDILTKIGAEGVQSVEDAVDILFDYEPDDEVEIAVIRSGSEKKFKVELDEARSDIKSKYFFRMPGENRVRWNFPGWDGSHGLERLFERRGGDSIDCKISRSRVISRSTSCVAVGWKSATSRPSGGTG